MPIVECAKCGRPLRTGGTVLFATRVQSGAERLGRYGRECARQVVQARAEHSMLTFANGKCVHLRGKR